MERKNLFKNIDTNQKTGKTRVLMFDLLLIIPHIQISLYIQASQFRVFLKQYFSLFPEMYYQFSHLHKSGTN